MDNDDKIQLTRQDMVLAFLVILGISCGFTATVSLYLADTPYAQAVGPAAFGANIGALFLAATFIIYVVYYFATKMNRVKTVQTSRSIIQSHEKQLELKGRGQRRPLSAVDATEYEGGPDLHVPEVRYVREPAGPARP